MRRMLLILSLLALSGSSIVLARSLAVAPDNAQFQRTWERTDLPVAAGQVSRTWMWSPEAFTGPLYETYTESPDGQRRVQYFDKSRMEITHPDTDANSIWYVTNGLLVVELVIGQMQVGDAEYEAREPATVNVAGDADDTAGPTYATFATVLDATPPNMGDLLIQRISRDGTVTDDPALAAYGVTAGNWVTETNHVVATPFWDFMTSVGTVWENGAFVEASLFQNAYFATGFPITEAYWATVKVGGELNDVLVQCFERRCLTYTPDNPDGWQVEAGNVGQHYYAWRYGQDGEEPIPAPTSTPTPTPVATPTPLPPTATPVPSVATTGNIQITYILWDSPVSYEREGEYVTVTNYEGFPIQMQGWTLKDGGNKHTYRFPSFILQPGASVSVRNCNGANTGSDLYTGKCQAWWNNEGDTGYLYDSSGSLISTYSY